VTVLLLDVMGTLVRDPFPDDVAAFFGLSAPDLFAAKDPGAWPAFERGELSEVELGERFFSDRRPCDVAGLKAALSAGYALLPGVEGLLAEVKAAGVEAHALSNYPVWYELIETKLRLSRFLAWTFVSGDTGVRKPNPRAYLDPAERLGRSPEECFFVDDRPKNVEAAAAAGLRPLQRCPASPVTTFSLESPVNRFALAALALALLAAPAAADDYAIDPTHTAVLFRVKHLGVSYTYGRFNEVEGTFKLKDGLPDAIQVTIQAKSVDTGNKKRDDHLRGPDFFNVKQFPTITFKSKAVKRTGTDTFEVTGELSLHGKTKEITFAAKKIGEGKDPWGGYRAGAELVFTVKRSEFGMTYMPDGIGDDVRIVVGVEGIKKTK
jgi:polyisoprenoid-binding protein YceI